MPVVVDGSNFTFLDAVNRILRANNIIRGDDDEVASFSDVQHNATLNMAVIAVQDEIADLISDRLLGHEYATGTINTSAGARVYSLEPDFVQFFGTPHLFVAATNRFIPEYTGGLNALSTDLVNFESQTGQPQWWYFQPGTSKQIGLYPTPDTPETLSYRYEKSVYVSNSSDVMPFDLLEEVHSFCAAAGRRFKFLLEDAQNLDMVLANDASYQNARGRLIRLMKGREPYSAYGYVYR